jgi:hypothetical protein
MLHTAYELHNADAGDDGARRRTRILTPLLKFRACRDARRATGDAMEVRGGCGYIEEWSDARLVRDAHLGSIWEGTSNVVALDVMRAVRREGALDALEPALEAMLPRGALGEALGAAVKRATAFAREIATKRDEAHARQAATGLYYAVAAAVLAGEGSRLAAAGDARRLLLSALVLEHRLKPRDPLLSISQDEAFADLLLPETPVPAAQAELLLKR